jgi:hypothetical protein
MAAEGRKDVEAKSSVVEERERRPAVLCSRWVGSRGFTRPSLSLSRQRYTLSTVRSFLSGHLHCSKRPSSRRRLPPRTSTACYSLLR